MHRHFLFCFSLRVSYCDNRRESAMVSPHLAVGRNRNGPLQACMYACLHRHTELRSEYLASTGRKHEDCVATQLVLGAQMFLPHAQQRVPFLSARNANRNVCRCAQVEILKQELEQASDDSKRLTDKLCRLERDNRQLGVVVSRLGGHDASRLKAQVHVFAAIHVVCYR